MNSQAALIVLIYINKVARLSRYPLVGCSGPAWACADSQVETQSSARHDSYADRGNGLAANDRSVGWNSSSVKALATPTRFAIC